MSWSQEAKDLIRKLLKFQPFDRCTALQARVHEWFTAAAPELRARPALQAFVVPDLLRFSKRSYFQRAALRAVAMQVGQADIEKSWQHFQALDPKGHSVLALPDLQELMGLPELADYAAELREVMGGGKVISPVLSMRSSLADSMLHARTIFSSKKQCQIGCQGRWHQRHSLTGCFLTTSNNFAMHEVKPVVLQGRYPSRVFVCVPQRRTLRELGSRSW
ncbi:unnamed protein product [Effrenium voratum]|nr:unnamed protein product [Effrenium voratum]